MAILFISHSSKDDAAPTSLEEWLRSRGFTDIFIDHINIAGGEKWAQALRDRYSTADRDYDLGFRLARTLK
jgi:hypothetical protein